jgi:hypothetical protein
MLALLQFCDARCYSGAIYNSIRANNGWENYRQTRDEIWTRRKDFGCLVHRILHLHGLLTPDGEAEESAVNSRLSLLRSSEYRATMAPAVSLDSGPDPAVTTPRSDKSDKSSGRSSFMRWMFGPSSGAALASAASEASSSAYNVHNNTSSHAAANESTPSLASDAMVLTPEEEAVLMTKTKHLVDVFCLEILCAQIASFL